ncbi:hypothetical protein [Anaeroselena agilis]|uniref:Uncharacterized protein n=1 Tax=Anaeroselena agilis TaxID=3063788 RepID=A0ABU3P154_9FIRM|nr:hypothetical protein [Selenomonadales bacterium 4137-cl]
MRLVSKKTVAIFVLGAFVLAGAALSPLAQAAGPEKTRPAIEKRQFDPDKAAQRLSETYGIAKDTVLARLNNGANIRDVNRAAFLAKASGKTLDEVLDLKTGDNNWKDVAKTLGVTREQAKATFRGLSADKLNAKLGFDRATVLGLLEQGYKSRDIAVAGLLAENADKTPASVLEMKKINNTWRDVAQSLGVSDETFKQDMLKLRQAFGHGGHHRFGHKRAAQ